MEQKFHIGVKALIENGEGEILITRGTSSEYWDLPGGRIDEGEGIKDALLRELKEEIGVTGAEVLDLYGATISKLTINTGSGVMGLCLLVYACKLPKDAILSPGKEHDEYRWVDRKELVGRLGNKFPREFLEKLAEQDKSRMHA